MNYDAVEKILNYNIFAEEKLYLLKKLASSPERYVGILRPTKPKTKLIQNLLQSREVRFGSALEQLIRLVISEVGFSNLRPTLSTNDDKSLSLDQYFTNGKYYYFVEQKIRDDHDTSKIEGQIINFEKKIESLIRVHHKNFIAIFYFIDPNLSKNKNYYIEEISRLKNLYEIDVFLFYGKDFFDYIGSPEIWFELMDWIGQWKTSLPDYPSIDLDLYPRESFEEIKALQPIYWEKILKNEDVWKEGIIRVLFSEGTTLKLLFGYFSQMQTARYQKIAKSLLEKLNKYYY